MYFFVILYIYLVIYHEQTTKIYAKKRDPEKFVKWLQNEREIAKRNRQKYK